MTTIKVTQGCCGVKYTNKNGSVRYESKTAENGAFEIDEAQAKRLVGLGVAEYVSDEETAAKVQEQDGDNLTGHLDAEQLETMTNEQLKNLAGDLGIDVSKCKKKADFIAAIVAAEVELGDEIDPDDEDDLPYLSAVDPE